MADNDYDEFGNFLGDVHSSDSEDDAGLDAQGQGEGEDDAILEAMERAAAARDAMDVDAVGVAAAEAAAAANEANTQIVLAEDKSYYPSAAEVYGKGTEAVYHDEDAQTIEEPLLAPRIDAVTAAAKAGVSTVAGDDDDEAHDAATTPAIASPHFMRGVASAATLSRHVAVVGHLHHGKSSVVDLLVAATHKTDELPASGVHGEPMRYTDTRADERARKMSVKATPLTMVCESSRGKSYAVTAIDAPGHPNFSDEMTASLRLADSAAVVVDAAEGVMMGTERAIKHAARDGVRVCLVINKVDRLITELKLPPADAYYKIKHTIDEVNALLEANMVGDDGTERQKQRVDPVAGNVCFCSAEYGFCFTLRSFARLYADVHGAKIDTNAFSARLWGDMYFHADKRAFRKAPPSDGGDSKRSFVEFVLEPLYKVFSICVGETPKHLKAALADLGAALPPSAYKQDVRPLLRDACAALFGDASSIVDMLVELPAADVATATKVDLHYTGKSNGPLAEAMRACDASGPLVVHVTKLYPTTGVGGSSTQRAGSFDALGRIVSGTLKRGQSVRVLGEAYSPDDDEDCATRDVTGLWLPCARYRVPVAEAVAGQIVLIGGVDASISKTATIVAASDEVEEDEVAIFRALQFDTRAVVKVATEPLNPSELPKVVEGLRQINKSYPLAVTKVEESGEHTILGPGEVYLDSVMHDLREMYANVEVKISDPVTVFRETVAETSTLKCFAETPNAKNKLTVIAEPLEKGLAEDIEAGAVCLDWPKKKVGNFFTSKYDWDVLAARSVWAFGPETQGPNCLLDDTLPSEVDKGMLNAIKASVAQGFRWGAREGPLCDEPVRGVRFKLLDATVADEPMHRGGGQVIPTARRACYAALLTAQPRLMEPVFYCEVQTPAECMSAIYTVLSKRRGHVLGDDAKAGTPVYTVRAYVPAIESFGLETDLRYHTQGQAFALSAFDHWALVPGDPLDRGVVLRPLEPQPTQHLAREFCVKTRRRKGMAEDVSVTRYLDDPALLELARADASLAALL